VSHPTNPESSVTSLWQPQILNFVGICFAHCLFKRTELMTCNSFHFEDTKPQDFDFNFHIHILLQCWRFWLYNCKSWPFVSGPHWMTAVTVQSLPTCCNILYCTIRMTILSKNLTLWYIMSDTLTKCDTWNAQWVQLTAYYGLY